ncbi:MAG TPA: 16S rRNA (cytidine(1402)-2'-O)-methyltransferase [Polyangiaceae bacterium]
MTLYVVATPIGNLSDMTLRAVETLRAVDHVVAEDTRRARGLLGHLGIASKSLVCVEAHASSREIERVVDWLTAGQSVALLTDAGMPSVSDPGADLVNAAVRAGVRVVPIPGPSAVTAAVGASGMVRGGFRFFGFLPRAGAARAEALSTVVATPEPVVLFESPQRMAETLNELALLCPLRALCVGREMTKMHEEFVRGTVEEVAREFLHREWIGEVTMVLAADEGASAAGPVAEEDIDARVREAVDRGEAAKTAAIRIAAWSGRRRKEIYEKVVRETEERKRR